MREQRIGESLEHAPLLFLSNLTGQLHPVNYHLQEEVSIICLLSLFFYSPSLNSCVNLVSQDAEQSISLWGDGECFAFKLLDDDLVHTQVESNSTAALEQR